MKFEIEIRKTETVEIDKETLKQECKKQVLKVFEKEFEKRYDNDRLTDIELYIDVDDIIAALIDEKYGIDNWDWA